MRIFKRSNFAANVVLILSIFLFSSFVCYGDWYLEQRTTTKSGDNPETTSIQKIYIKDKMMKVEDDSNNMDHYFRLDKDVIWFADRNKKVYYEKKLSQMLQITKMFKQSQVVEMKELGEKKKIGKYTCEGFEVTNKGQLMNYTMEMWVTKEIKIMDKYRELFKAFRQYSPQMYEKMMSLNAYPVLTKITSNAFGTQIINTSELIKIEEKKLGSKIFDIPPDYKLQEPAFPFEAIKQKINAEKSKTKPKTEASEEKPPVKKESTK